MGALGVSKSHSQAKSTSGTQYPTPFVQQFTDAFGRPLTQPDIESRLPQTPGLFQAQIPGYSPTPSPTPTPLPGGAGAARGAAGNLATYTPPGLQQGPGSPNIGANAGINSAIPGGTLGGINALGFGQAAPVATPPPGVSTSTINAPEITLPGGSTEAFRQNLFEQQFRPVERELTRAGAIQDRATQAQLAQSGLATSGAGFATLGRQQRERSQQLQSAATDAATNAAVQAYQADLGVRLQNAGFSLQSQQANASNVLQGNLANAQNYLSTIGLNQQGAEQARSSFLQLMGLQEADLQRLDTQQRGNLELVLNNWLQQFSSVANAGQFQTGKSLSSSVGVKV